MARDSPGHRIRGNPFAAAGIVEIEHGSNGVYPEAVDVVLSSQKRALEMRKFWNFVGP